MPSGAVSVIIPCHNGAPFISRAIRSVQGQTERVGEIVVVDDHSTDDTAGVVAQLAEEDGRIRLVRSTARGAGHARNVGVRESRHELIAFLDADDLWYPDKLETQLPLLADDVAFVGANTHYVGEDGTLLGSYVPFEDWDEATESLRLAQTMPVPLSTGLMRRDVFVESGGFDETFLRTQDLELAQRLVAGGRRIVWPKGRALAAYVLHSGGVSATSYREQFLAAELVRARVAGRTDKTYEQWQREPELDAEAVRRLRSGEHYRKAAVAKGAGDLTGLVRHGVSAVATDPKGVAGKLAMRGRHRNVLEPAQPPRQIRAELNGSSRRDGQTVGEVSVVDVAGLKLVEDPIDLVDAIVPEWVSNPRLIRLHAAHITSLNHAEDPSFVEAFNEAEGSYVDGVSLSLIAAVQGQSARKTATTDLAPELFQALARELERPARIVIIGGAPGIDDDPGVAVRAGQALEADLPVEVVLTSHGFHADWRGVLEEVRAAQPDVVLVGMGMPLEAFWTRTHRNLLPSAVVLTCGGWLRILAGEESRAPEVMQDLHLEWLHRLVTDPRRTGRRYAVGAVRVAGHAGRAAAARLRSADRA